MYRTEWMDQASRRRQEWLPGDSFTDLQAAKRDCCYRCLAGARHTRLLDAAGEQLYFMDNPWTSFYDLATWDGHPDPDGYADELEGIWRGRG